MQVTCKVCGESIDDSCQFCPYCGVAHEQVGSEWNNVPTPPITTDGTDRDVRRSVNIPLIVGAVVISFTVILGSIFWIIRQKNSQAIPVLDPSPASDTASPASDTVSPTESDSDALSGTLTPSGEVSSTGSATALTAEVSLTMPDDIDNYHKVSFTSGDSSSVLERVNDLYHYEPSRAFDNDPITSWQEGNKKTDGQGEWLELHMNERKPIKYITLCLGNWRDAARYASNNRPTELNIKLGGKIFAVKFEDVMKPHYVTFSKPVEADSIRFTIAEVVVGTNGDHDCCISEVYAYSAE